MVAPPGAENVARGGLPWRKRTESCESPKDPILRLKDRGPADLGGQHILLVYHRRETASILNVRWQFHKQPWKSH